MDWFSWLSRSNLESSLIYEYGLTFASNELQKEDLSYFNHEFLQSMGISVAKHRLEILKLARKEAGGGPKSFSKVVSAINRTRKSIANCFNKFIFLEVVSNKCLPAPPTLYQEEQCKEAMSTRKPMLKTRRVAKSGPLDGRVVQEKMIVANRSLKPSGLPAPPTLYQEEQCKEAMLTRKSMLKTRRVAKSGPLDGRMVQEKMTVANRSLKLSGPLDGNMQERLMITYRSPISYGPRSPKLSGPLDKRPPSPRVYADYSKEKMGGGGFEDQTLWANLFQDMKPT